MIVSLKWSILGVIDQKRAILGWNWSFLDENEEF